MTEPFCRGFSTEPENKPKQILVHNYVQIQSMFRFCLGSVQKTHNFDRSCTVP